MDGATVGLAGGIVGTVIGCLGAYYGARASYRAAVNDAQRELYQQSFRIGIPIAVAFLAVVWLTALHVLPYWTYVAVMVAWFGALGPLIAWFNRRLAHLAAQG